MNIKNSIGTSWSKVLEDPLNLESFLNLQMFLEQEKEQNLVFPPSDLIFSAFTKTAFEDVKVVILGQDPYHGEGQAHGLSFSVPEGVKFPPSLRNIFKELNSDLGIEIPLYGNLNAWAEQGVLLLNATLTVRAHKAGSHQKKGWEQFTDSVIQTISDNKEHVVFVLWGNFAQSKSKFIDEEKHCIVKSVHPSPLSANRGGFFGSQPFSKTNVYLSKHNIPTINWKL